MSLAVIPHDELADKRDAALAVWHAARASSGNEPDPARIRRVREKLSDPTAQLVLVERADDVAGMALAEPFRIGEAMRTIRAGWGHISMVFVHPRHQGAGVGERTQRWQRTGAASAGPP